MTVNVSIQSKTYPSAAPGGDKLALADISFEIPKGQFTCLVGPSGCGKTTLLNIVSGIIKNVDGNVAIDNLPPDKAHLGYMFQTPRLMPWLSVLNNVRLALEGGDGNVTQDGMELARGLLEEMGLGDVLDSFPGQLSGGMERRVALARAFVVRPDLLLMDEPFISLDSPAAIRLRKLLLQLWNERPTTVLFVTHDLSEALLLADRIIFLSPGPGRVVLDYEVPLPRPRANLDPSQIEDLRRTLLKSHPDILTGLAAP